MEEVDGKSPGEGISKTTSGDRHSQVCIYLCFMCRENYWPLESRSACACVGNARRVGSRGDFNRRNVAFYLYTAIGRPGWEAR
jgi:hypothetical protein